MTRNKRPSPGGRRVLALAAAGSFLVAAACGGDDGDDESASNPFCEDFEEFDAKWEGTNLEDFLSGDMDESESQQVIADLNSLDPPEEIADEWPSFVSTIETLIGDPEAANNPENLSDLEAIQTVQTYVNEQCTDVE